MAAVHTGRERERGVCEREGSEEEEKGRSPPATHRRGRLWEEKGVAVREQGRGTPCYVQSRHPWRRSCERAEEDRCEEQQERSRGLRSLAAEELEARPARAAGCGRAPAWKKEGVGEEGLEPDQREVADGAAAREHHIERL